MKKSRHYQVPEVAIDPRDPNKELWEWLLAGGQQEVETRAKHSHNVKQQRANEDSSRVEAMEADHREKREAWLTDQELLLTQTDDDT